MTTGSDNSKKRFRSTADGRGGGTGQSTSDRRWPMARSERQENGTRGGVGTLTRSGTRSRPQAAEAGQSVPGRPVPGQSPQWPRRSRPVPPQRPADDQPAAGRQRPGAGTRTTGRREERAPAQRAAAAPPRPGQRRRAGVPPQAPATERATGPQQRIRTTGPQPAVTQAQATQARPQAPKTGQANAAAGGHRMPFVLLLCGLLGGALVSALVISTTLAAGSFQISKLQSSTASLAKQQQALEDEVAQAQAPQQIAQRAGRLGMRRVTELQFMDLTTGKVTNDGPTWSGALGAPGYAP